MVRLLTILFLLPMFASGTTWYVDVDNVSGTTNGTSWATAWVQPADIVWGGISAGDTVEFSDGIYTNAMTVGASGTSGNPITIKVSQDPSHNGVVFFSDSAIATVSTRNYLYFDGRLDSSFTNPTNYYQVTNGVTAITNNIGMVSSNGIVGFYGTSDQTGNRYSYIGIFYATNHPTDLNQSAAFSFPVGTSNPQTENIIEYCYVNTTGGDAIQWTGGGLASGYDEKIIRFCYFHHFGDDGIQANHGFTVTDSIIGPAIQLTGHADFVQSAGDYLTLKNTVWIQGGLNSFWRIQAGYGGSPFETFSHYRFYNNLFLCEVYSAADGYVSPANPIEIVNYNPQVPETNHYWIDFLFANNTAYNYTNDSSTFFSWNMSFGNSGGNMTNTWITNSIWANNLVIDCNKGVGANWVSDLTFPPYGQHYRDVDLIWDYNVITGTNYGPSHMTGLKTIGYRGTAYSDGVAMAAGETWQNNVTNYPAFADHENYDLELSISDTVALNQGTNLSSYFTVDALNRPRNAGGAWDIGALENQEADGLMVFLSFDNDTGTNAIDDSGNGYFGQRMVRSSVYPNHPTNGPVSSIASTVIRPNATGNAYDFLWASNSASYGLYGMDGGYFCITNAGTNFDEMTSFTLMVWARHNALDRTSPTPEWTTEGYSTIMGSGTASGTVGSWDLMRFNSGVNLNETRWLICTNATLSTPQTGSEGDRSFGKSGRLVVNFPDAGGSFADDTTNWNHYAITFTNGVVTTYYNGSPWTTNDISGVTNKLSLARSAQRNYGVIAIGANIHQGTPEFDDESPNTDFPNQGFMNGGIDQPRIYSRALSHQDIVDVAVSEGGDTNVFYVPDASVTLAPTRTGRLNARSRGRF